MNTYVEFKILDSVRKSIFFSELPISIAIEVP
jgi:hypothetical protein